MTAPWETEEVPVTFDHEGYKCHILRAPSGHLNGYVQIHTGHPLYQVDYSEPIPEVLKLAREVILKLPVGKRRHIDRMIYYCTENGTSEAGLLFDVHGGVTYSGQLKAFPDPDSFWYGFDCAHAGDFIPKISWDHNDTYRDLAYVTAETQSLAAQLKQLEKLAS